MTCKPQNTIIKPYPDRPPALHPLTVANGILIPTNLTK